MFLALPDAEPTGRPLAVKDLFDTAGLVTTYGSPLFGEVPTETAPAVAAVAAQVGTPEMTWSATDRLRSFDRPSRSPAGKAR